MNKHTCMVISIKVSEKQKKLNNKNANLTVDMFTFCCFDDIFKYLVSMRKNTHQLKQNGGKYLFLGDHYER